ARAAAPGPSILLFPARTSFATKFCPTGLTKSKLKISSSRPSSPAMSPSSKIFCCPFAFVALAALTNSMSLSTTFFMNPTPKNSITGTHMLALRLADLPADSLTPIEHDGLKLVVIRSGDRVFAYHDKCPHAFWPLSQGTLHRATLEC